MSNTNAIDEFLSLSDADINFLYEIVLLAARKPGPPFGPGLFAAYDEIIARENVKSEDSSKFFAFICRMVAGRTEGQTVYERFDAMLRELGIHIEPNEFGGGEYLDEITRQGEEPRRVNGEYHDSPTHARQHQTNGIYHGDETNTETNSAQLPIRSRSAAEQPSVMQSSSVKRRSHSHDTTTKPHENLGARGRLNARASSDTFKNYRRGVSVTSNQSLKISRSQEPAYGAGDAYSADESDAFSATLSRRQSLSTPAQPIYDPHRFLPPGLFQRSEDEMLEDAEAFQHSKAIIAQRSILWEWRHKAVDLRRDHQRQDANAVAFDRGILLRNALSEWRARAFERMQEKETERFFGQYEERATRAREVFVLTKAFTHWAAITVDKLQKTSLARRHILRTRYFNAWRDITAVNQLKVRRHILKKFFVLWQQRNFNVAGAKIRAVAVHDANIVRRTYWQWFYNFCDQRAPEWRGKKRMRVFFFRWLDIIRQMREREQWVEQMRAHRIQRKLLLLWVAKGQRLQTMRVEAGNFGRSKALTQTMALWSKRTALVPLAAQVSQRVDRRTLHTALSVWNTYTQLSLRATKVHEACIVRKAFTDWNDQLRVRYLEIRIDARSRAEAFYKWIFRYRSNIASRDRDLRIGTKWLEHWVLKTRSQRHALDSAAKTLAATRRRLEQRNTLNNWRSVIQRQQQREVNATSFCNSRILAQALSKWQTQNANIQQMNNKADAARYYILTTSSLKSWKGAMQQHQRFRRRDAYAQVRRRMKMSLAREMLRRMQERLAQVRAMERTAIENVENQAMRIATSDFNSWKAKVQQLVEQTRQANGMYQRKVLQLAFRMWQSRHQDLQRMDQIATIRDTTARVEATNSLRQLNWRLFEIRGREKWAIDLREKHMKKHIRNMLRYWVARAIAPQRSQVRQGDRLIEDDEAGDIEEEGDFLPDDQNVPEIGDLTAFDNSAWNLGLNLDLDTNLFPEGGAGPFAAENIISSTPLPGYLRTPSKRNTARAKARERLVGLTATAPPTAPRISVKPPATAPPRQQSSSAPPSFSSRGAITPFERKLRAQGYSGQGLRNRTPGSGLFSGGAGGRLVGRGKTPARSTVGFAGFEDIPENSERSRND